MSDLQGPAGAWANMGSCRRSRADEWVVRTGSSFAAAGSRIVAGSSLLVLAWLLADIPAQPAASWVRSVGIPAVAAAQQAERPGRQTQRGQPEVFRTEVPERPYDIVLGNPSDVSVTASIFSTSALAGYFEYGDRPGNYEWRSDPVQLGPGMPVEVILDGLSPNSQYFYRWRVTAGSPESGEASDEFTFRTGRSHAESFVFTVQADSHLDVRTDPRLYEISLRNAKAANPDFHIDLGDTFMTDKRRADHREALPQYLAQRYYFGLIGASSPVFLVSGNHDGEGIGRGAMGKWAREQRETYFATPSDGAEDRGNYYSWEWGDALFVALDPYWATSRVRRGNDYWTRTLGEDQYRWLATTLRSSRARFKFVFIHHLVGGANHAARGGVTAAGLFEWGGRGLDGTYEFDARRPGWGQPIHRLLVDTGVIAVFHGHDHVFAREELDGIAYVLLPQPGLDRYRAPRDIGETYPGPDVIGGPGHVRVTVSSDATLVELVQTRLAGTDDGNGRVAHSFRLDPNCSKDCQ